MTKHSGLLRTAVANILVQYGCVLTGKQVSGLGMDMSSGIPLFSWNSLCDAM